MSIFFGGFGFYLGAPYAFINKVFLLIKKKMMSIFLGIIPGYLKIPFSNGCQALAKQSRWQPCQGWALYVLRREHNRDTVLGFFIIGQ